MNFFNLLFAAVIIVLAGCTKTAHKPIVFDSQSHYVIVVPQNPTAEQTTAAEQLSLYLKFLGFMNDAESFVTADKFDGERAIFIGRSEHTEDLYRQYGSQIHDDGFLLHSDGSGLYILGREGKAELYGVYHLLENYFDMTVTDSGNDGIFFFSTPKKREICVHDLQNPSFKYRETLHYLPNRASNYADWHKLHCREDFNKDWGLFVHTFGRLVPVGTYFDEHPEWFSEVNGQRIRDGQLCLSNSEVLEVLCDNLAELIAQNPNKKYWSVSQNDNEFSCTCPHCLHLDSLYGGQSGTLIHFVNQVAERFPDKTISTLAYQQTRRPPQNIKPADNINIMFCSIECQRQLPIAENPAETSFQRDMKGWTALTHNILLWDYVVQFRNYLDPFPNLHVLQSNLKNFYEHGIPMMFEQGSSTNITENHAWRTYLIAHLLWDVNTDVDNLRNRFLTAHYGEKRAPFIRQYLDTMQDALLKSKQVLNIYGYPIDARKGYLSPEKIQYYRTLLEQAKNVKPFDDDAQVCTYSENKLERKYNVATYDDRLRLLELSLDFAVLELSMSELSPELSYFTIENGKKVVRQEMIDMADTFVADCHRLGVAHLDEISYTPEQLRGNIDNFIRKSTQQNMAKDKKITSLTKWSDSYDVSGPKALVDGIFGIMNYNFNWLGFQGEDMDVIIDLDSVKNINNIHADFFSYPLSWIFVPKKVTCYVSNNNADWSEVASKDYENEALLAVCKLVSFDFSDLRQHARYVRIKAESLKVNPAWHRGVGQPCWIFCDEILIK